MNSDVSSNVPEWRVISSNAEVRGVRAHSEQQVTDCSEADSLNRMNQSTARTFKRLLDICLAVPVVLICLPPLCAVVKFAQWMQSPGPLFYRQKRCGRNRREFTILKFRTMNLPGHGQCEIKDDPHSRIYPFGRLLRRTKLDEVPQFVNVLMGTMSVVGPRPHHSVDCDVFASRVSLYNKRFVAKPGITGLAQISEYRGDFEWNCVVSRVEKDIRYIAEWTFWGDVKLVVLTVGLVAARVSNGVVRRISATIGFRDHRETPDVVRLHVTESDRANSPGSEDAQDRKAA